MDDWDDGVFMEHDHKLRTYTVRHGLLPDGKLITYGSKPSNDYNVNFVKTAYGDFITKRRLYLSKLILSNLYFKMREMVDTLRSRYWVNAGPPIWLAQL
ncbi:hypothetical protein PIB30_028988 [Stylosanthes scabra]|uniref:Uncharacterized protein n=1 Tax=Stylosanthes scabra TaxID=79078 RepID=A0ABU6WD92_9FABA|nr:hypothetical protein [Stylosanthes scabra]